MMVTFVNKLGAPATATKINDAMTRVSMRTGTLVINLSLSEFAKALDRWKTGGVLIQLAFPTLNDEEREFLMTGMTPEMWARAFSSTGIPDNDT